MEDAAPRQKPGWCEMEVEPIEGSDLLMNGSVDPQRFDELAAAVTFEPAPQAPTRRALTGRDDQPDFLGAASR